MIRGAGGVECVPLRQFNQAGVVAFKEFLEHARNDLTTPVPWELLVDPAVTEVVRPLVEVDRPGFNTKGDAAQYLSPRLAVLPEEQVLKNGGLWTWLALFYFDDVCPAVRGHRRVLNDYYYVFMPADSRRYYRHLLWVSYRILRSAPCHNRLLLQTPLSSLGKVTERVMERLYLTRIKCMFEILDRLYFDERRGKAKPRIVDPYPRPGDLRHRLPVRIRQLEKTYDLNVLTADQLIGLLGEEFRGWVGNS